MVGNVGCREFSGENIRGQSSGEFNRTCGQIQVNISKLLMLVELLLGSTEVPYIYSKALRILSAEEKTKLFCFAAKWERLRRYN